VLTLVWGVIATWWVGLGLDLPLAFAARRGHRPKRTARSLLVPVARLLLGSAIVAAIAGAAGWFAARNGWVFLVEPLASDVPAAQHVPFVAVLWTHLASYAVRAIGGLAVQPRVARAAARVRRAHARRDPLKANRSSASAGWCR
jgi:hypothetical protein